MNAHLVLSKFDIAKSNRSYNEKVWFWRLDFSDKRHPSRLQYTANWKGVKDADVLQKLVQNNIKRSVLGYVSKFVQ